MANLENLTDTKVKVSVYDRSKTELEPNPISSQIAFLCPLFGSSGKSNELMPFTSASDIKSEVGEDMTDLKKYGQQGINALHALQGGGKVWACRLLPDNAKRASIILQVHVKKDEAIPQYERDKEEGFFLYDDEGNRIPLMEDVIGEDEMPTGEQQQKVLPGYKIKLVAVEGSDKGINEDLITNSDDWKVFPLLKFTSYRQGKCGNNLAFAIMNDYSRDKSVSDGRRYMFEFYTSDTTGLISAEEELIQFAFNPDAKLSSTSNILEGLQNVYKDRDPNRGYNYRDRLLKYYHENYLELITYLSERFDQEQNSDFDIDFITCTDKYKQPYDTIILDEDSIDFTENGDKIFLKGGHDGSLQLGNEVEGTDGPVTVTDEIIEETKKKLLKDFYEFKIDKRLADCRKVSCGIALDANYDMSIKRVMGGSLIEVRNDIFVMFDCGITQNMQEAITISREIKSNVNTSLHNHAIFPHCGSAKDNDTINGTVTQIYEVAYSIPYVYTTKGNYSIVCSYQTGLIRTLLPDWIVNGSDEERTIEKYDLCYISEIGDVTMSESRFAEKKYYQIVQKTLYNDSLSVLKNLRNALIVTDIVRVARVVLIKYVNYTEGADVAMETATAELKALYSNRYPSNVTTAVSMTQTTRDKQLNECSANIDVTFPNIIETFNVVVSTYRQAL